MKIAYQKYPLVGNYIHPWVLLTIIINTAECKFYFKSSVYNFILLLLYYLQRRVNKLCYQYFSERAQAMLLRC